MNATPAITDPACSKPHWAWGFLNARRWPFWWGTLPLMFISAILILLLAHWPRSFDAYHTFSNGWAVGCKRDFKTQYPEVRIGLGPVIIARNPFGQPYPATTAYWAWEYRCADIDYISIYLP
jgi:hypothetical protein